jgi:hypothetical protein
MNTQTFVNGVRTAACEAAANGTLRIIERPPGRSPSGELISLSRWYNELNSDDREKLAKVVTLAANQATYSFLLILDGLLAIEPSGEKGSLELYYNDGKTRTQLNDQNANLSSLFKALD